MREGRDSISHIMDDFKRLFQRVFLDTNVVRYIAKYGETIFDNQDITDHRDLTITNFEQNVEALRYLFGSQRLTLPLVVSRNVIKEIIQTNRPDYTQYALELSNYCQIINEDDEEYSRYSDQKQLILEKFDTRIGFLSDGDRKLIFDAIRLRCHYFMTVDLKLLKNTDQIKKFTNLTMLQPLEYWNLLKPWAGLWL